MKKKLSVVKDREYGTYFWELPSGKYLGDTNGDMLTMEGKEHDLAAIAQMAAAARACGFPEGKAVWKTGVRKLTDAEYELMMERLEAGLTPDPADEYLDALELRAKEEKKNG